jgi:hypothetical protein
MQNELYVVLTSVDRPSTFIGKLRNTGSGWRESADRVMGVRPTSWGTHSYPASFKLQALARNYERDFYAAGPFDSEEEARLAARGKSNRITFESGAKGEWQKFGDPDNNGEGYQKGDVSINLIGPDKYAPAGTYHWHVSKGLGKVRRFTGTDDEAKKFADKIFEEHIRPLSVIAKEIAADWKNLSPYAKPYLDAMRQLKSINDSYYADDARSVVLYFLSNASSWKGDTAKRIKAELKQLLKQPTNEDLMGTQEERPMSFEEFRSQFGKWADLEKKGGLVIATVDYLGKKTVIAKYDPSKKALVYVYENIKEMVAMNEAATAKLVKTLSSETSSAKVKVYYDREFGEYVAKLWDRDGKRYEPADYFTDDKDDALSTAEAMLKQVEAMKENHILNRASKMMFNKSFRGLTLAEAMKIVDFAKVGRDFWKKPITEQVRLVTQKRALLVREADISKDETKDQVKADFRENLSFIKHVIEEEIGNARLTSVTLPADFDPSQAVELTIKISSPVGTHIAELEKKLQARFATLTGAIGFKAKPVLVNAFVLMRDEAEKSDADYEAELARWRSTGRFSVEVDHVPLKDRGETRVFRGFEAAAVVASDPKWRKQGKVARVVEITPRPTP